MQACTSFRLYLLLRFGAALLLARRPTLVEPFAFAWRVNLARAALAFLVTTSLYLRVFACSLGSRRGGVIAADQDGSHPATGD